MDLRETLVMQVVFLPCSRSALGHFCVKEVDQQELWKFTSAAVVEICGQQIIKESQEILESSEFSTELRKIVCSITDLYVQTVAPVV